jgi:hypothetical protein
MIIDTRTEPVQISEIDTTDTYYIYVSLIDTAGTKDDYYDFITTPSPERTRFLLKLQKTIQTADNQSIITLNL